MSDSARQYPQLRRLSMKLLSVAASRFPVERVYILGEVLPSKLDFHIGNANSQLFAWAKTEAKMAARRGNFVRQFQFSLLSCTSVPVLCMTSVISICWVRLQRHSQSWKSVQDEILLDQFYIIDCLKGFKNAVWSKKCAKLSKHGKLSVKRERALGSSLK